MNAFQFDRELDSLYAEFEAAVRPWKAQAVCGPGCATCCTHYGRLDVVTLEALRIHDWLEAHPLGGRREMRRAIEVNRKAKEAGRAARCPFLAADRTCRIYPIRPFSCRQLYSLKPCEGRGATLHRGAVHLAEATVTVLKALDANGYAGHISFLLHLLDQPEFARTYRRGGFDPAAVATFGRAHGLTINRLAGAAPLRPLKGPPGP